MFGRSKLISIHSLIAWFMEEETFRVSILVEAFRHKDPVYSIVRGLWYPICSETS